MPRIELSTTIAAPISRCYDLSRSIDLHQISTEHTNEKAIAGVTSGLIGLNESVTWQAKHLGVTQQFTSLITELTSPVYFVDEMQKGIFKHFRHEHHFEQNMGRTTMKDVLIYTSPLGLLGTLADVLFLKHYMRKLLVIRNEVIKEFAESERWQEVL